MSTAHPATPCHYLPVLVPDSAIRFKIHPDGHGHSHSPWTLPHPLVTEVMILNKKCLQLRPLKCAAQFESQSQRHQRRSRRKRHLWTYMEAYFDLI